MHIGFIRVGLDLDMQVRGVAAVLFLSIHVKCLDKITIRVMYFLVKSRNALCQERHVAVTVFLVWLTLIIHGKITKVLLQ